tara:strand:+ start:595 stop:879 length:285 start_codon:yes stop_codon:yes gene_type:complete
MMLASNSHTFVPGDLVMIKQGTRAARRSPTLLYILLDKLVKGVFLGKVPKEEEFYYDIMYLSQPCRIAIGEEVLIIDAKNINHYSKRRTNEKVN